ncbi:transglutaminase-like domain-containing protein [Bariatricus sp. SGI.161]|uniref:transglutaminase-like domain-containing protein n=1 Tax=Bariatricus sp. SGI.161 TaxID=3420550 RepID=UPI002A7E84D3|nr:transglutaminase family protein [Lachnospiraceae bacterium]MDY2612711.1 transglutaminase family protein [Lachnospiraceae bacterium]
MKSLQFTYRMELRFDQPVCDHYFALRCVPTSNDVQKIQITSRYVSPTDSLDEVIDGFGNHKYVGHCANNHMRFAYEVEGTAVVSGMQVQRCPLHPMYRFPSRFTEPSEELKKYGNSLKITSKDHLKAAVQIMDAIYQDFSYVTGSTNIHTTAGEAWKGRKGVCQDYAHIMIALCRMKGIPARYVNGLMIGEGYTHAWVEIYTGEGWYGLDPTNHLHVDDYYIKLAHGRDYGDCVLDKGLFRGQACQSQKIYVNVEEI